MVSVSSRLPIDKLPNNNIFPLTCTEYINYLRVPLPPTANKVVPNSPWKNTPCGNSIRLLAFLDQLGFQSESSGVLRTCADILVLVPSLEICQLTAGPPDVPPDTSGTPVTSRNK